MIKKFIKLLCLMLFTSVVVFSAGKKNTLLYDDTARVNMELHRSEKDGYYIRINSNKDFPYIIFETTRGHDIKAIYHYQYQYWVRKDRDFTSTGIDLSTYFTTIKLSHGQIDRFQGYKPDYIPLSTITGNTTDTAETVLVENTTTTEDNKREAVSEEEKKETKQSGKKTEKKSFSFVPNLALNNTRMYNCKVVFMENVDEIWFNDLESRYITHAVYKYKNMHWSKWTHGDFAIEEVDLSLFFTNMNSDEAKKYNRWNPDDDMMIRVLKETEYYDYSNDKDFADFIAYAGKIGAPDRAIDFYLRAANNPEVRTRMQFYFDMHHNKRGIFEATAIFKKFDKVPLTILELSPVTPSGEEETSLRGAKLRQMVKKDFEAHFKKSFSVKTVRAVLNYEELALEAEKGSPLYYQGLYLKNHIDHFAGKDRLILYYFTDKARLKQFPRIKTSNPMGMGTGAYSWDWNIGPTIHELGHTMGLPHHFPPTKSNIDPEDINDHTSASCIMNYALKSEEFCELCRYALGVER